jgi:cell division septation protein DedD
LPYFRFRWLVGSAAIVLTILIGVNLLSNQLSEIIEISDVSTISVQEERNPQTDVKIKRKTETASTEVIQRESPNSSDSQSGLKSMNSNVTIVPNQETNRPDNNSAAVAENDTLDVAPITQKVALKLPQLAHIKNENITNDSVLNKKQKKVMPKEYLSKIAAEEYGIVNDTVLDIIHMTNPEIKDLNLIFAGQIIRLPQISRKDLIVKDSSGRFHIHYASHYNFEDAQVTVQNLLSNGRKAFIFPSNQGEITVYRIYCGIFSSRFEAEEEIKTLKFESLPFLE